MLPRTALEPEAQEVSYKRSSSELRICVHLSCPIFCRCWFGKEPGDLVDYIYQGPIILVLLVRLLQINGLGH